MYQLEQGFEFDDVLIIPKYSNVNSRSEVDISVNIKDKFKLEFPVIASPMRGIVDSEFCIKLAQLGGIGILHRFYENKLEWQKEVEKISEAKLFGLSVGLHDTNYLELLKYKPNILCIDVANGGTQTLLDFCKQVKKYINERSPDTLLMSGNVATYGNCQNLADAGVDLVRVGIGGGCFAAGTRILMSNGYYKNIELLNVEEEIIDGNGFPTKVLGIKRTGYRKVVRYRHNKFYMPTVCTAEHLHRVYDLNGYAESTIGSGLRNLLIKNDAKWKPVYDLKKRDYLVFPKNIDFNMPNNFQINMFDFCIKNSNIIKEKSLIESSYELGYIFGTFLGDGSANVTDTMNKNNNWSQSSTLTWSFGVKETLIANKLMESCEKVFGKTPKIMDNRSNMIVVKLDYQALAKLFLQFGKHKNKNLPIKYFCSNKNYLKGIHDGLVDSDGSQEDYGRISLYNTSEHIIELFNIITFILEGTMPSNSSRKPSEGGLKNCDINNCSTSYGARIGTTDNKKNNEFYNMIEFLDKEPLEIILPVYDIEVESEDHSFIANNAVVHNSLCSTRNVTGIGVPQLSALLDCAKATPMLVADGGIRNSGDAVKCFVAGADVLMIGALFGQTYESPSEDTIYGMASKKLQQDEMHFTSIKSIEGIEKAIEKKMSLKEFVDEFSWGIRSAGTYLNAKNLDMIRANSKFILTGRGSIKQL